MTAESRWFPGARHSMDSGPWDRSWRCVDCRQVWWTWPPDGIECPGPDSPERWWCPNCSREVPTTGMALFADTLGEFPWVCGRCYAKDHPGEAVFIVSSPGPSS